MIENAVGFSPKLMCDFVETLSNNLGNDTLSAVLDKAGLPIALANCEYFTALDDVESAQFYSKLQAALRTYYGRGARGILLRIGGNLWRHLLKEAAIAVKAQATILRGLPIALRRKRALDLLARFLSDRQGDITVHTLDPDLIFVDHASPTTLGQTDSGPVCFVTLGMIRECLYWVTGYEHDIEEISCRARGAKDCEFKITIGG